MKKLLIVIVALCCWLGSQAAKKVEPVVVAYVTSWTRVIPDPTVMTHLNYAFGHVNNEFNGVRIDNEERLRQMVALKKTCPGLHVMLSIGGWGSGRFSEMAATEENRLSFATDCRRVCEEYGLDGIDIDWEYPTQKSAGISCSPADTDNFTLLMRDLRQVLGNKLLLTMASVGSAQFVDFRSCVQYLDMVNVMSYDMGNPPKHHATLHRSSLTGWLSAEEAVEAHRKAGVPDSKITMGMPFYGRGKVHDYLKNRDELRQQYTEHWDEVAQVPYLTDKSGTMVLGYDNARSLAAKCRYIQAQGLRGAMYWEYGDDNEQGEERRAVWRNILQNDKQRQQACRTAAQRLAAVLQKDQKREEITPDSFFHDMRALRRTMLAEKDPTAQAILQAVMAHRLCMNAWRSQAYSRQTKSHPDSLQEWSSQEYGAHAADLYADALRDMDALHGVTVKDVPAVVRNGKDASLFGGDILSVIWQCATQDLTLEERQRHLVPGTAEVADVYRRHGLREAALLLTLDAAPSKDELLRLKAEYADIPACAEVYLRLADVEGTSEKEQYQLCEEALSRYPKSRQANALKNRMTQLRQPQFAGEFANSYYPGHPCRIPIRLKNMLTASISVYRLPEKTLVETLPVSVTASDPLIVKEDTISWQTPAPGRYALVLGGTTKEKLEKGYRPDTVKVTVSALTFMSTQMPDGKTRIMVTDALSGEPQSGVSVDFLIDENNQEKLLSRQTTDSRGITETTADNRRRLYAKLSRGEDNASERQYVGGHWKPGDGSGKDIHQVNLFTDRSIYRPGQTVYVAAIAHVYHHLTPDEAEAGKEVTLTYRDANGEEIAKHTLTTDAFGTVQDSLVLPKGSLPGRYSIFIPGRSLRFQVEEYRRPTFEVTMDEPKALSLPADSVTLTGRAVTYSQWPVANARVTGTCQISSSWWLRQAGRSTQYDIDTLQTDSEGRFTVRVPLDIDADALKLGQMLYLSVDVLSPEGETQSGSLRMSLCNEPLRMRGAVGAQQLRESLSPWRFDLLASNDKAVQGTLTCTLTRQDDGIDKNKGREPETCAFILPANCDTIPEVLRTLPSGTYDLVAKADIKGDTASCRRTFTISSLTDRRLLGRHPLSLLTASDTISAERPARVQIGTTLPEAWAYCFIAGENGIVRDTILHLQNEAILMELPYEQRYLHHLTVNVMLMHDGQCEKSAIDFKYVEPDRHLRMHWDTFRDHLQPGRKEQWRLTLTRPDGTPAAANVMVGMYDASLDALSAYDMGLTMRSCTNHLRLSVNADRHFLRNSYYTDLPLPLVLLPYQGYDFAGWRDELFHGQVPKKHDVRIRGLAKGAAPTVLNEVYETLAMPQAQSAIVVEAAAEQDMMEQNPDDEDAAVSVRENLSELAFFLPQLRTDSKGQTAIEFTLPEGLTSWHLHGLAHTQDMLTAQWEETIVAQKALMAELSLPRFLRHGDEAMLTASIRNASGVRQKGEAVLDVYCTEDNWSVKRMKVKFDLQPAADTVYHLPITATLEHPVLSVQWIAKGRDVSDGELRYLPILSDKQNVTETRTYTLRGDTALTMPLTDLFAGDNPKATGRSLTIEHFTSPTLLALQTLPSLTAPVRSDVLSIAAAYYGGSVAQHIAQKSPDIREAIEAWAKQEKGQALESPLVRNQQLSDIILNETPWMLEARQQQASRQRIVDLLDEMQQEQRRMTLLTALSARQNADGSFGWFPGMGGNRWITTEVARLLIRLNRIKREVFEPERQVFSRALGYLNAEAHQRVEAMKKEKQPQLTLSDLQYLYIYIMYTTKKETDDTKYLLSLLSKQADSFDREERALAAFVLHRAGKEEQAKRLMPRLHELLRHADGAYLAYPGGTFTSIDRKVDTHVALMEAIRRVEPDEKDLLSDMTAWLIQQKRTQEWDRPVQSADAVYALLRASGSRPSEGQWRGRVSYDQQKHRIETPKPFYGYVRERVDPIAKPKELYVEQQQTSGGIAWGAVYAQYQLPAQEAEAQREGMTIRRDIDGGGRLREGDRVHVRYTITADRDYEYVCLKAPRPSAAEPANQLSGYRYQSGLGYYMAHHDASTEYFMDRLPRGTYVIEEDWLITRSGSFLLPSARLTCLYAPEYQSQTAGVTFRVQ